MKQTTGGMEMYMIRGTELQDFLRCRLAWKYRWIDGLQPKKQNDKLVFGTAVHKFLEIWYETGQFPNAYEMGKYQLDCMDELEYQDNLELYKAVTTNYYNQYSTDFDNWEVIATELTFAIPLDDEIGYTGTIDLIVRDKSDGKIYLVDHKTTNSIEKYDKNSDMDRQISRYWWALEQLQQGNGEILHPETGEFVPLRLACINVSGEIGGFYYNIILKDYPVPPKILKNGSLSRDKSQHTTYEMYMRELRERGLTYIQDDIEYVPYEYEDIVKHLADNPREYFRRIRVTRTKSEIDASIEELYDTAIDMGHVRMTVENQRFRNGIYRNITKDCPWCPFQPICQASMDGSNVEYLVESLYTKGE